MTIIRSGDVNQEKSYVTKICLANDAVYVGSHEGILIPTYRYIF